MKCSVKGRVWPVSFILRLTPPFRVQIAKHRLRGKYRFAEGKLRLNHSKAKLPLSHSLTNRKPW